MRSGGGMLVVGEGMPIVSGMGVPDTCCNIP